MNDKILQQIGTTPGEYRVFGPPGTGKTTITAHLVEIAQQRFGSDSILVTSFSKAAAKELTSRNLPVQPEAVGTLHHHCYYALGGPKIIETMPPLIAQWNREYPRLEIKPSRHQRVSLEDEEDDDLVMGDLGFDQQSQEWFPLVCQLRGQMIPQTQWRLDQREAFRLWEEFKKHHQTVDFTDLIEHTWRNFKIAPGDPRALFADEAQDLNPLELALVRQWGEACDYSVLAFDDDQAIYCFTGVDPHSLLSPEVPESHKLILDQSHRLSASVHRLADYWIHQLGDRRQEKEYRPRASEGQVAMLDDGWNQPKETTLARVQGELASGRKVMLLASCAYMLRPLTAILRARAIPFHNPYRPSHNGWNPLGLDRPAGPAARVRALIAAASGKRRWKTHELALWIEPLLVRDNLLPGAKDRAAGAARTTPTREVGLLDLKEIFTLDAARSLVEANQAAYDGAGISALTDWWHRRLGRKDQGRYQMAVDVASARGVHALERAPQLIVGTIHSVKGGEADTVVLLPDVSPSVDRPYDISQGHYPDDVIRTFYVGMTRAREHLYLAAPASKIALCWPMITREAARLAQRREKEEKHVCP